jgi:hypothetical protein
MIYEFTKDIPKEEKSTEFKEHKNWDETKIDRHSVMCCNDCRYFSGGIWPCSSNVGMLHKPCKFFDWD